MKIKHAIFDLDGTLIDSNGVWFGAIYDYIDKQCSFSLEDIPEEFSSEIVYGGSAKVFAYLERVMGDTNPLAQKRKALMDFAENAYKTPKEKKGGVVELLSRLKGAGADICVVTATPTYLATQALELSGLLGYVDFIISSAERKSGKDKPYILIEAAARMNADPSECTIFEDAIYGIRTGKMLGMTAVGVEDRYCSEKAAQDIRNTCDLFISNFSQIELD